MKDKLGLTTLTWPFTVRHDASRRSQTTRTRSNWSWRLLTSIWHDAFPKIVLHDPTRLHVPSSLPNALHSSVQSIIAEKVVNRSCTSCRNRVEHTTPLRIVVLVMCLKSRNTEREPVRVARSTNPTLLLPYLLPADCRFIILLSFTRHFNQKYIVVSTSLLKGVFFEGTRCRMAEFPTFPPSHN